MDPKLPPTLLTSPPPPSHASSSYASFPILAISILGILTTAILLLSYYIFITKCCLHWHRPRLLLLLFHRRALRHSSTVIPTTTTAHHHPIETHGLDLPTINSIPTLRFKANPTTTTLAVVECAVCLSEFQHQQLLRLLPNCSHSFHVDCIDTWLQSNDNCPLCRAQIQPYLSSIVPPQPLPLPLPLRPTEAVVEIDSPVRVTSKMRRESRGDEWIDTREKVQPIRRSFSMDSCNDRQLYVSVQEILRRNPGLFGEDSCSSSSNGGGSGRIRRSLFSFGRTRSSTRSASVLPI